MMLVGESDAVRCKLFMSTLTGMAMDWFISLLEGHITSFAQLSQLFREHYLANRAPPPVSYDLFDVKQYQGETLKEYINRFGAHMRSERECALGLSASQSSATDPSLLLK